MNLLQYIFCFMFWFFGREACGILAPRPRIEPAPPALEGEVCTTGPPGKSQREFIFIFSCNLEAVLMSEHRVHWKRSHDPSIPISRTCPPQATPSLHLGHGAGSAPVAHENWRRKALALVPLGWDDPGAPPGRPQQYSAY